MEGSSGMWMLLAVTLLLPVSSMNTLKQGVKSVAVVAIYPQANTQLGVNERRQKQITLYKQNNPPVANYLNQRAKRERRIHQWLPKLDADVYPKLFAPQYETWDWQDRQFLFNRWGGPWAYNYEGSQKPANPENPGMKDLKEFDDPTEAFTEGWFKKHETKILEVLNHNINAMKIKSKDQPLEDTDFSKELLDIAASSVLKTEEKTSQINALFVKYELQYAVKPPSTGKECLWSGHVDNSNFAQEQGMTPLETPPLMKVLSKTFGTENFPKGVSGKGFGERWLPNVCPMFNAATLIYCWDMKPTAQGEGTLPVYANQLKSSSAFFDTEINEFVGAGYVKKIKFIILFPPPTVAEVMVVEVDVVAGEEGPAKTRDAVKEKFASLSEDEVKKLYENRFNIFIANVNGGKESHPLNDPAKGTRQESNDVSKATYKAFFKNTAFLDATRMTSEVAASSSPDKFEFYLLGTAAFFLIVIAYHILKNIMTQKSELNIVFNMESPADQYTKFEVI